MPAGKTKPNKRRRKRILLVDDHALLRRGLKALIETEPDLVVCAEAATRNDGIEMISSSKPNLVIADLSLQDSDGLEMIKDIRKLFPRLPVLALSMHDEQVYAERALRAGAGGYVTKQEMDDTILIAIRRVLAGNIYTSEAIGRKLTEKFIGGGTLAKGACLEILSDRELEVFTLIGQGKKTGEIAKALCLSVKTIESYREHLKNKLDLSSGTALARCATLWAETGRIG